MFVNDLASHLIGMNVDPDYLLLNYSLLDRSPVLGQKVIWFLVNLDIQSRNWLIDPGLNRTLDFWALDFSKGRFTARFCSGGWFRYNSNSRRYQNYYRKPSSSHPGIGFEQNTIPRANQKTMFRLQSPLPRIYVFCEKLYPQHEGKYVFQPWASCQV